MEDYMARHANEGARGTSGAKLCVLEGERVVETAGASERTLPVYNASVEVGLCTIVHDAAIEHTDEHGDVSIELPKVNELMASVAVARCMVPIKLRGSELKAMRKILGLTLAELAANLDERTAPETISRWETEAQPMGGYAEKLLRLMVCESLHKCAPGIAYNASMIANLKVRDPWKTDPDYKPPCVQLYLVRMKEETGSLIDAWNEKMAA
jgi:DNA-binding transcriptional regulator YiaG